MSWGQRRRQLTDDEKAANAAAREARKQLAMTCQCCGRDILANTGTIAHHGYQRPGDGWQTDSCGGAKELPFEVSRDALGREIAMVVLRIAAVEENRAKVQAETIPVVRLYSERVGFQSMPRVVSFTRATFDATVAEKPEAFRYMGVATFDECKRAHIDRMKYDLGQLRAYRDRQQGRYDGWAQTHERRDDQWVKVAA